MNDSTDADLELTVTTERGATVVTVAGELDAASAPELVERLSALPAGVRALVLDLMACEFLDSTGLHAIIDARAALEARGGDLFLACRPDGAVARVVEVALPGVMELHASRRAALDAAERLAG